MVSRRAIRDPYPITRRLAFAQLLAALTPEHAVAMRDQLVSLGADGDAWRCVAMRGDAWRDFHYGWGAIAGKDAFDHAAASKEEDLAATLTGWAAAPPSQALVLLDHLPEAMRGQRGMVKLCGWLRKEKQILLTSRGR